jgi:hypothetical protein
MVRSIPAPTTIPAMPLTEELPRRRMAFILML